MSRFYSIQMLLGKEIQVESAPWKVPGVDYDRRTFRDVLLILYVHIYIASRPWISERYMHLFSDIGDCCTQIGCKSACLLGIQAMCK